MNRPTIATLLVALLAIGLMGLIVIKRAASVRESAGLAPGTAQTSGCEEESLYAVWRSAHGQPIYTDTAKVPFAAAYFNWLFYRGYGPVLRPLLARRGDAALPYLGRLITLIGALIGGLVAVTLFTAVGGRDAPALTAAAIVLGLMAFLGPLPGWWILSVRPDIWALALETAGVATLLLLHRRLPWTMVVCSALLFYAAWSCKQTYVAGAGASLIFLLARRNWRDALLLASLSALLVAPTILMLGPDYRFTQRAAAIAADFQLETGWSNLVSAIEKSFPLLLALPLVCRAWREQGFRPAMPSLASDALLLGTVGLGLSLAEALPASCKSGAATNYYFTCFLMLGLATVAAFRLTGVRWTPFFVCSALVLLLAVAFSGRFGTLSIRPEAELLARRWTAWQQQPEPRYSSDSRLNLPWLLHDSPPIVRAFNYEWDRAHLRHFEAGGIGGLIESGFFASLLLPRETTDAYDRGLLSLYIREGEVAGLVLFRRRDQVFSKSVTLHP
jgi:hypothetical protein